MNSERNCQKTQARLAHPPLIGNLITPRSWSRNGLTLLSPARKVPIVGEALTLSGFDRLDQANIILEENTLIIGLLDQRQTLAIGTKSHVLQDEVLLRQAYEPCYRGNFIVIKTDITRPATTITAALTLIIDILITGFSLIFPHLVKLNSFFSPLRQRTNFTLRAGLP